MDGTIAYRDGYIEKESGGQERDGGICLLVLFVYPLFSDTGSFAT